MSAEGEVGGRCSRYAAIAVVVATEDWIEPVEQSRELHKRTARQGCCGGCSLEVGCSTHSLRVEPSFEPSLRLVRKIDICVTSRTCGRAATNRSNVDTLATAKPLAHAGELLSICAIGSHRVCHGRTLLKIRLSCRCIAEARIRAKLSSFIAAVAAIADAVADARCIDQPRSLRLLLKAGAGKKGGMLVCDARALAESLVIRATALDLVGAASHRA